MSQDHLWESIPSPKHRRVLKSAMEALPPAVQQWLVAEAGVDVTVAPSLFEELLRCVTHLHTRLPPAKFAEWRSAFTSLQAPPAVPRAGLEAFLAVSQREVTFEALAILAECACFLAPTSPRLAGEFLLKVGPLVGAVSSNLLREAAQLVKRLATATEWRGEFAASAFLDCLPRVLDRIAPDALARWCAAAAALHRPEKGRAFFSALPESVLQWGAEEQRLFFEALHRLAHDEHAAWELYLKIPVSLRGLAPGLRKKVLQAFARSAPFAPQLWVKIAPVAGALFAPLSAVQRRSAGELLLKLAAEVPPAVPEFLRRLPYIYERATNEQVHKWVEYGVELFAAEADRAQAYFGLDTRTSVDILGASPTTAVFPEVQQWLRKLAHMLSAVPLTLRPQSNWTLRPSLESLFEERIGEVPDRLDVFPTHEENLGLYRFLVMQLAGRLICGTAPEAPRNWPRWKEELEERGAEHPRLYDWFLVTEGIRVGSQMAERFRGWGVEQRHLLGRFCARAMALDLDRRPSPYDWLLAWELAGVSPDTLPETLRPAAVVMRALVAPLHRMAATADDAWVVAKTLEQTFATALAAQPLEADAGANGEVPNYLLPVDLYDGDAPPTADALPVAAKAPGPQNEPAEFRAEVCGVDDRTGGSPLPAEALEALLKAGASLELKQGRPHPVDGLGLSIADLLGKLPQEQLQELRSLLDEGTTTAAAPVRKWLGRESQGEAFYYDEWDYLLNDYRPAWCRIVELCVESDSGEFFSRTLAEYAHLLPLVRREFQKIRPDSYRVVRGLEAGEDFDLNALVDARGDRRARRTPSTKLYVARQREERDVAVLFLVDMSASTDEPVGDHRRGPHRGTVRLASPKRIIDITKEALVIMAEALEELGDAYAIYGFSGHGRQQVELYTVKSFREGLSASVRGRIGAMEPKRSTRMGAALRHAITKMAEVSARSRHILLLSDGFPQDFDYGQDRRSNTYGLRDTAAALQECEARGITPFCITVDRAGHDYLREMCPQSRYLVIDDIAALPRELPKIYQRVVTG